MGERKARTRRQGSGCAALTLVIIMGWQCSWSDGAQQYCNCTGTPASCAIDVMPFTFELMKNVTLHTKHEWGGDTSPVTDGVSVTGGYMRADGSLRVTQDTGQAVLSLGSPLTAKEYLCVHINGAYSPSQTAAVVDILADGELLGQIPPVGTCPAKYNKTYVQFSKPLITGNRFTVSVWATLLPYSNVLYRMSGNWLYPRVYVSESSMTLQFKINGITKSVSCSNCVGGVNSLYTFVYSNISGIAQIYTGSDLAAENVLGGGSIDKGTQLPLIGRDFDLDEYLNGKVTQLFVWQRDLAPSEIAGINNNNYPQDFSLHYVVPEWCETANVTLIGDNNATFVASQYCQNSMKYSTSSSNSLYVLHNPIPVSTSSITLRWRGMIGSTTEDGKYYIGSICTLNSIISIPDLKLEFLEKSYVLDTTGTSLSISWKSNLLADSLLVFTGPGGKGSIKTFKSSAGLLLHSLYIRESDLAGPGVYSVTARSCAVLKTCTQTSVTECSGTSTCKELVSSWDLFTIPKTSPSGEVLVHLFGNQSTVVPQWPVTASIPLPQGQVYTTQGLQLYASNGTSVTSQFSIGALWTDMSIQWVTITTMAIPSNKFYILRWGESCSAPTNEMSVVASDTLVTLSSDVMLIELDASKFCVKTIGIRSQTDSTMYYITSDGCDTGGLFLYDEEKASFFAGADVKYITEEAGPVRTVVKIEGAFTNGNSQFQRFEGRIFMYAGSRFLKFEVSLLISEVGETVYLDGTAATNMNFFSNLEMVLPMHLDSGTVTSNLLSQVPFTLAAPLDIYQQYSYVSDDKYYLEACQDPSVEQKAIIAQPVIITNSFTAVIQMAYLTNTSQNLFYRLSGHGLYPRASISSSGYAGLQFRVNGVTTGVWGHKRLYPNTIYHIAFSYDNNTGYAAIYINGTLDSFANLAVGTLDKGSSSPYIGFDSDLGYTLHGRILEFSVYPKALSADDIIALYNSNTISQSPILRYTDSLSIFCHHTIEDEVGTNDATLTLSAIRHEGNFLVSPLDDGFSSFIFMLRGWWQLHPKSLGVTTSGLHLGILPTLDPSDYLEDDVVYHRQYFWADSGTYRVRQGVRITTEFMLDFDPFYGTTTSTLDMLEAKGSLFNNFLVMAASPKDTFSNIGPVGFLQDAEKVSKFDSYMSTSIGLYLSEQEQLDQFSFMNTGDWYGERIYNWGNLEYDLTWVTTAQFVRSGDIDFAHLAAQCAWHSSDIDVIHYGTEYTSPSLLSAGVPILDFPWEHSFGHTGGYDFTIPLDYDSGEVFLLGSKDYGHVWAQGLTTLGMLLGEPRFLEDGIKIADHLAYSCRQGYSWWTSAERAAGWPLTSLMSVYLMTHDSKYLTAADIIRDAVSWRQDPQRGYWPYWQSSSECEVDFTYWGGKSFMVGVLLHGLHLYDYVRDDSIAQSCITKGAFWLWNEMYNSTTNSFAYTQCPQYLSQIDKTSDPGSSYQMIDALTYASYLDPELVSEESLQRIWTHSGGSGNGKGWASTCNNGVSAVASFQLIFGLADICGDGTCSESWETPEVCPWDCDNVASWPAEFNCPTAEGSSIDDSTVSVSGASSCGGTFLCLLVLFLCALFVGL
ncbi:hypothetical protein Pelo_7542 [Pelomyxa schiedti]|nr:hypothetical protein Pelo_7542 [Pelomyxa schiedti]